MRIALDGTSLVGSRSGVGAVVDELTKGLAANDDIDLTVLLISRRAGADLGSHLPPGAPLRRLPLPAQAYHWAWRYASRPSVRGYDVVHGPNYVVPPAGGGAELLTIHDFTAWRFPELVGGATHSFPRLVDEAIRRGAHIHAVSNTVAEEALHYLPIPAERVHTISNGMVPPSSGDASAGLEASGGHPYLLALGTIEPRKDHPTLLRAFAELRARHPDLRLVVAGGDGWGTEAYEKALAESGVANEVIRLGYVSENTKADLLAGASVFVYPSIYEGFGLPPLEAAASGVPVVATAVGSIPEVMADGALLVPSGEASALADAIDRVLTDDNERLRLLAAGAARVEHYTWPAAVDALVDLYRRLSSP
ncbi:MAG: glycosyltransferase family 1 protein [Acidimicrobiales bacterium]